MEKDKDNLEKETDSKEESKSKKSKYAKSSTPKISEAKDSDIDKSKNVDSKNRGEASFFGKRESKPDDMEDIFEEDSEQEPGLSEEEVHEATLAIVDSLTQEVAEELSAVEPDSPEEFEALADAVFLEELLEIAEGEDDITEESISQAFDETLADLDVETDNEAPEESINESGFTPDNIALDASDDSDDDADANNTQAFNTTTTSPAASTPPVVPPSLPPSSVNNGPNVPPLTPNYRYTPANTVSAPTVVTKNVEIIHGRRSDMLVGAIIGYIVGRRGGRKRTEKKLNPKINKLEEQVTDLHYKIINKEAQIRSLARQKAESHEKVNRAENKNRSLTEEVIEQRQIKKKVKERLKRREELSKDPGVEKIGKFSLPALKVFHERRLPDGSEDSPVRKQVEAMTESELLEKIGDLRIEGYEVKTIYQNGRLNKESLRQITKEYLRGGPYKQTFIRELLRDNQEIEKSREVVNSINNDKTNKTQVNSRINEENNDKISKEEAMKKAEALLMTHTEPVSKPKNTRVIMAATTLLVVIICAFIILLLS